MMEEKNTLRNRQRRHVVDVAADAFRQEGIRSVTMDDIAHRLTMSKRTLYQLFRDKEELLLACFEDKIHEERQRMDRIVAQSDNVLEALLRIFRHRMEDYGETTPDFFLDLQKYPAILEHHTRHRRDEEEKAVEFMQRGIEQGLFRRDVDFQLVVPLITGQIHLIVNTPSYHEYRIIDIFLNTLFVILRGCATPQGVAMMDDFVETLRREQEQRTADADAPDTPPADAGREEDCAD